MSKVLWIAALVIMPSVANAGTRVTPPKGWQAKPDEAKATAEDEMRALDVKTETQIWEAPSGGKLEVSTTTFPPFEAEMSTTAFVDAAADVRTRTFVKGGAKLIRSVKARVVNGQIVAERVLRGTSTHVFLTYRALKAPTGELQLASLVCWDQVERTCKKAAASLVLTPL